MASRRWRGALSQCSEALRKLKRGFGFVEATNAHYRLNEGQRFELRARLMDARQLNATEDGIRERYSVGL